jgi:hypothetical protein
VYKTHHNNTTHNTTQHIIKNSFYWLFVIMSNNQENQLADQLNTLSIGAKKKFTHSNNVILKVPEYKGQYAFVQEFHPSNVEVQILDTSFVSLDQYGTKKRGETFISRHGPTQVLGETSVSSYKVEMSMVDKKVMDPITGETVVENVGVYESHNIPQEAVMKVILVKNANGTFDIAQLVSQQPAECVIAKADLDPLQSMDINELKRKIASNPGFKLQKQESMNCKYVIENFLTESNSTTEFMIARFDNSHTQKLRKLNGKPIVFEKYVGKQYIIQHPRIISVQNNQIEQQSNKKVKIIKGEYKNYAGQVIRSDPAYLTVYIGNIGKTVSSYVDKNGKTQKLQPTDVFYVDMILANGNAFQVNTVSNNEIKGIEKTPAGYIPKTINQSEIARLQPGFSLSLSHQQPQDQPQDILEEEDVTTDAIEERDDVSEPENDGTYQEPQDQSNLVYDEPQLVSSFKDRDRLTFQNLKLTRAQDEIKRVVDKILVNIVGRSIAEEMAVPDFILNIEEVLRITKSKLQSSKTMQNKWTPGDKRVIIACMVLRQIIKKDYAYFIGQNNILATFIDMLVSKQIINKKYTESNIFLVNGWTNAFTVPVGVKGDFSVMFLNCYAFLDSIDEVVEMPVYNSKNSDNIQLLKVTRMSKEPVKRIAYANDILNNTIPSTATKVLWAPRFNNVLVEYHKLLDTRVKTLEEQGKQDSKQKSNYINSAKVYKWVNENLEQAPFVLPQIPASLELANDKKQALEHVFGVLLTAIRQVENEFQSRRSEILQEKQTNKQTILENRKRLFPAADSLEDIDNELEKELDHLTLNPKKRFQDKFRMSR